MVVPYAPCWWYVPLVNQGLALAKNFVPCVCLLLLLLGSGGWGRGSGRGRRWSVDMSRVHLAWGAQHPGHPRRVLVACTELASAEGGHLSEMLVLAGQSVPLPPLTSRPLIGRTRLLGHALAGCQHQHGDGSGWDIGGRGIP